jgi:hypothetical protein
MRRVDEGRLAFLSLDANDSTNDPAEDSSVSRGQAERIRVVDGVVCRKGVAVGVLRVEWGVEGVVLGPASQGGVVPAGAEFHTAVDAVLGAGLERVRVLGRSVPAGVRSDGTDAIGVVGVGEAV